MTRRTAWNLAALASVILIGLALRAHVNSIADELRGRFTPPNERTRRDAIGSTAGLSRELKRAYAPSSEFDPIPSPQRADWLANHHEPGQTFAQFVRSMPNRPTRERRRIYLQPLGDFEASDHPNLEQIRQFAEVFYGLPVLMRSDVATDDLPIQRRRSAQGLEQLKSTDILNWLRSQVPRDAYCLLAVTMTDLYPDDRWNFVFGQASLRDRVGVYSFARYTAPSRDRGDAGEGDGLVLQRACKVLAHETGHMFGMKHCIHFHCLMNGSNHLSESDRQPIHLCPVCLRKLQSSIEFDVSDRYEALHEFAESANWLDERDWLSSRIKSLREQ